MQATPAGEFDRQVTIERNVPTRDASMGGEIPAWSTFASGVWARVRETPNETSGSTGAQTNVDAGYRAAKVRIRYLPGIDATMRLREGTQLWRITGVAVLGRQQEIELAVREWAHE